MKNMMQKTNVMRLLEQQQVDYVSHSHPVKNALSGTEMAMLMGEDPAHVFKTLVTVGHSGEHFVFMVPVAKELNLKKAAAAVGEKKIEMIRAKELLPLTGYVHGGCSPIGMKKLFRTVIDASAARYPTIIFSAGKIGYQVELPLESLQSVIRVDTADLT